MSAHSGLSTATVSDIVVQWANYHSLWADRALSLFLRGSEERLLGWCEIPWRKNRVVA